MKHVQNCVYKLRTPIQKYFGTIKAALLVEKFEYWFSHNKFHNGFYKFTDPCEKSKPLYREGDSWTEELGISRRTFNKIFDLIGIRYSSESAFKAETDRFKGKLYASYHNRQTHTTHYVRNHEFVQAFFKSLDNNHSTNHNTLSSDLSEDQSIEHHLDVEKTNIRLSAIITDSKTSPQAGSSFRNDKKCRSPNVQIVQPINIQDNTYNLSSLEQQPNPTKNDGQEEDVKKMFEVWEKVVGGSYIPKLSKCFILNLREVFQQLFNGCLDKWKAYCHKIASSKFLMGEHPTSKFKIWFTWAIKPEIIERIMQNGFTFGDRINKAPQANGQNLEHEALRLIDQQPSPMQKQFHHYLLEQGGADNYHKWFKELQVMRDLVGPIIVKAKNRFMRDNIISRFESLIRYAVNGITGNMLNYEVIY